MPTAQQKQSEFVERAMAQAQVFASAWSMVGGRFDYGYALDHSNDEKASLRGILESHAQQQSAVVGALVEALKKTADLAWIEDSHSARFDGTVLFGPGYDFSGIDGPARQEFLAEYDCIVWPSGGLGSRKWSAYCSYDGSMWFEKFDSAEKAKETCMRLLETVLPDHPAIKASAALALVKEAK